MRWLVFLLPALYLLLCAAAIIAVFISTEPLVGLYAVLLAWPWMFVLDWVVSDSLAVNLAAFAAVFALNAYLLYLLSLWTGRLLFGLPSRKD